MEKKHTREKFSFISALLNSLMLWMSKFLHTNLCYLIRLINSEPSTCLTSVWFLAVSVRVRENFLINSVKVSEWVIEKLFKICFSIWNTSFNRLIYSSQLSTMMITRSIELLCQLCVNPELLDSFKFTNSRDQVFIFSFSLNSCTNDLHTIRYFSMKNIFSGEILRNQQDTQVSSSDLTYKM